MKSKKNKDVLASGIDSGESMPWFWVNRHGFPLNDVTYVRLWRHVCKVHPDGDKLAAEIRDSIRLHEVT